MNTTTLKIEGMSCGHCVSSVTNALTAIPGVTDAEVNLEKGQAIVQHEPTVDATTLVNAVTEEGYTAEKSEAGASTEGGSGCPCCQ